MVFPCRLPLSSIRHRPEPRDLLDRHYRSLRLFLPQLNYLEPLMQQNGNEAWEDSYCTCDDATSDPESRPWFPVHFQVDELLPRGYQHEAHRNSARNIC